MASRKEFLAFGPERMLQRVVRLLGEVVRPVLVAGAEGQELPALPADVEIVRDRRPDCGPLAGLEAALLALRGRAQAVFMTACDVPLLKPAFVRRIVELAPDRGIGVLYTEGVAQPLAALYHADVLPHAERLLDSGQLRPLLLFDLVPTRRIDPSELADCDPELQSLCNVNTPEEYQRALARAGFGA
jgi:molybdopterin-guanine dinucleotide biosynthesis protein A